MASSATENQLLQLNLITDARLENLSKDFRDLTVPAQIAGNYPFAFQTDTPWISCVTDNRCPVICELEPRLYGRRKRTRSRPTF
jgi:hypothetical protein